MNVDTYLLHHCHLQILFREQMVIPVPQEWTVPLVLMGTLELMVPPDHL